MSQVVPIKGNTKYTINLDPSVWIFDKRKIDLTRYIQTGECIEVPEREATGSYGIPFKPFLLHAEPLPDTKHVHLILTNDERITLTLDEALSGILGFAFEGKALKESGPLMFYFGAPSHRAKPIAQVSAFEVTA